MKFNLPFLSCILVATAMLFLLSVLVITPVYLTGIEGELQARVIYVGFILLLLILILRTGKISTFRSIFFIISSFSFIYVFAQSILSVRGHLWLTEQEIVNLETPICHIALPFNFLPALLKKFIIFPTQLTALGDTKSVLKGAASFYPMLFIWIVITVVIGRGWCSWVCFFGGIDEGFSKILPKSCISTQRINFRWQYLRLGFFVFLIIVSYVLLEPFYCSWVCPLKLVTEYPQINSLTRYFQCIIFITLGMALLIILPLLTKRRTFCGLVCPLGIFQALVGKVSPYRVRIDPSRCRKCRRCLEACPTFSIREKNDALGITFTCTKCGRCIQVCPKKAIDYYAFGHALWKGEVKREGFINKVLKGIFNPRTFFIFSALLCGAIIGSISLPKVIMLLFRGLG